MQVPAPTEYAPAASVDPALELSSRLGPEALLAGGRPLLRERRAAGAAGDEVTDEERVQTKEEV